MTKKRIIGLVIGFIVVIIAVIIILLLTGVLGNNSKKPVKVNELYAEFNNPPEKIEVTIADGYVGTFTVEKTDEIEQIYALVMSMDFYYGTGSIPPGSNVFLKFIYSDDTVVNFTTRSISFNGRQYYAKDYFELNSLLDSMGLESGLITPR